MGEDRAVDDEEGDPQEVQGNDLGDMKASRLGVGAAALALIGVSSRTTGDTGTPSTGGGAPR